MKTPPIANNEEMDTWLESCIEMAVWFFDRDPSGIFPPILATYEWVKDGNEFKPDENFHQLVGLDKNIGAQSLAAVGFMMAESKRMVRAAYWMSSAWFGELEQTEEAIAAARRGDIKVDDLPSKRRAIVIVGRSLHAIQSAAVMVLEEDGDGKFSLGDIVRFKAGDPDNETMYSDMLDAFYSGYVQGMEQVVDAERAKEEMKEKAADDKPSHRHYNGGNRHRKPNGRS